MAAAGASRQTPWRLGDLAGLPDRVRRGHVAVGRFDGVHIGHRALVQRLSKLAETDGAKAVVVTFELPPGCVHVSNSDHARLTDTSEKFRLLIEAGADEVVNLEFDQEFAALPIDAFISDILAQRFEARSVVTSKIFSFGQDRSISPGQLAEIGPNAGLTVDVIAPEILPENGEVVSSTTIRALLAQGKISEVNRRLGRRWTLNGRVVHGDKRGRELGFPTANIILGNNISIGFGIYAVRVLIDGRIEDGVASYGRRPQFDNGLPRLEVHLLDFQGDLYGKDLRVEFVSYQRPELVFGDLAALLLQMGADCAEARRILSERQEPGIESGIERSKLLSS